MEGGVTGVDVARGVIDGMSGRGVATLVTGAAVTARMMVSEASRGFDSVGQGRGTEGPECLGWASGVSAGAFLECLLILVNYSCYGRGVWRKVSMHHLGLPVRRGEKGQRC